MNSLSILIAVFTFVSFSFAEPLKPASPPIEDFPKGKKIRFKEDVTFKVGERYVYVGDQVFNGKDDCALLVEIREGDLAGKADISSNDTLTVTDVSSFMGKEPGKIPAGQAFTYYRIFEGGEVWNVTEMTGLTVSQNGFTYKISAIHTDKKYWEFKIRRDNRFQQNMSSMHKDGRRKQIELVGETNAVFYRNPDNTINCLEKHVIVE